ncbi:MAG: repressor LexA [Planctomycetes bacterium]|nr:repressor LexA [Planctomycetota bacterium]MCB9910310.1 repressor LexA [Planctomycetota bacterium]MCB9912079.1 repressor LexA [Planctomycetota bacterium]HPF13889.1 transcriptional repressor LexA [Planctomycetota bacterium]
MATPLTARQRDILNFFREYSAEQGISPTLEEIASHFGVNKVTIFGHVAELERKGVLKRAAPGVSRGLQLVDDDEAERSNQGPSFAILGNIAAGAPIEATENPETLELGDLVPRGSEVYALRVQGNSMIEDAIADGDLVLVERRSQAHNGETVVAVLPDGTTTLKRFYREKVPAKRGSKATTERIRLQPANAAMQPIYLDDVEIRGVVTAVVRRL